MNTGIKLENMNFDITIAEYLIDSTSSTSYECSAIAMKYLTEKIKSLSLNGKNKYFWRELNKPTPNNPPLDIA